jgi:hypothetical protein
MAQLKRDGITAERVLLDPDSFSAWCAARSLPLDAQARSQYVSEVVATKHRPQH